MKIKIESIGLFFDGDKIAAVAHRLQIKMLLDISFGVRFGDATFYKISILGFNEINVFFRYSSKIVRYCRAEQRVDGPVHVLLGFCQFLLGVGDQGTADQIIVENEYGTDDDEYKWAEVEGYFGTYFHEMSVFAVDKPESLAAITYCM